jgi:hypothetical protein
MSDSPKSPASHREETLSERAQKRKAEEKASQRIHIDLDTKLVDQTGQMSLLPCQFATSVENARVSTFFFPARKQVRVIGVRCMLDVAIHPTSKIIPIYIENATINAFIFLNFL